jgi:predicted nucleic acid-binding protein
MATKILDSWSMIAFLQDDPAAEEIEHLFIKASQGKTKLLLSVISWAEVYYSIAAAEGERVAEDKTAQIATLPIEVVPVGSDLALARDAAKLKGAKSLSLGNAFAAALARGRKADLVTGDPEFRNFDGELKIEWLRTKPSALPKS